MPLKITVKGANSAQRAQPPPAGQPAPQTQASARGAHEASPKLAHEPLGHNGLPRAAQQTPGGAVSAHGASAVSAPASGAVSGSSGGNPLKKKLSLKIKKADPALTPAQQIANEVNNRFLPPATQAPVPAASAAASGAAAAASTGSTQRKIISIKRSGSATGPGGGSGINFKPSNASAALGNAPGISIKRPLGADGSSRPAGGSGSGPRPIISIKSSSSITPSAPSAAAGGGAGDGPAAKRPRITPHGVVGGQARQTLNRYLPGGRGRGRGRGPHTAAAAGAANQNHPIMKRYDPHPPSVGSARPAAAGGGGARQQAAAAQQPQPAATPPKPVQASTASALPTAAAAAAAFAASMQETVVLGGTTAAAGGAGSGAAAGQAGRGPVKLINVKGTAGSGGSGGVVGARGAVGASAGNNEGATTGATGSGGVAGGVLGLSNGQMQLLPDVPVSDALLKQLLGTIEKKDKFRIFAAPVTEAVVGTRLGSRAWVYRDRVSIELACALAKKLRS